jgi:hypothetical protein
METETGPRRRKACGREAQWKLDGVTGKVSQASLEAEGPQGPAGVARSRPAAQSCGEERVAEPGEMPESAAGTRTVTGA